MITPGEGYRLLIDKDEIRTEADALIGHKWIPAPCVGGIWVEGMVPMREPLKARELGPEDFPEWECPGLHCKNSVCSAFKAGCADCGIYPPWEKRSLKAPSESAPLDGANDATKTMEDILPGPFVVGVDQARRGHKISDNPYKLGTKLHRSWVAGFKSSAYSCKEYLGQWWITNGMRDGADNVIAMCTEKENALKILTALRGERSEPSKSPSPLVKPRECWVGFSDGAPIGVSPVARFTYVPMREILPGEVQGESKPPEDGRVAQWEQIWGPVWSYARDHSRQLGIRLGGSFSEFVLGMLKEKVAQGETQDARPSAPSNPNNLLDLYRYAIVMCGEKDGQYGTRDREREARKALVDAWAPEEPRSSAPDREFFRLGYFAAVENGNNPPKHGWLSAWEKQLAPEEPKEARPADLEAGK